MMKIRCWSFSAPAGSDAAGVPAGAAEAAVTDDELPAGPAPVEVAMVHPARMQMPKRGNIARWERRIRRSVSADLAMTSVTMPNHGTPLRRRPDRAAL